MKTCTNRIPDNCDSYECGRPVVRAGRCEACLPAAIAGARTRLRAMERATGEARARLRDLEGDTADHAKRLAEIEALLASVPGGVWSWEEGRGKQWTLYVDRGEPIDPDWPPGICNRQHGFNILRGDQDTFDGNGANLRAFILAAPTMLRALVAEHRAASEALAAAGIPDDDRALAERVKALATVAGRDQAPDVDEVSPAHLRALEIVACREGTAAQVALAKELIGMGPAAVAEAVRRAYEEGRAAEARKLAAPKRCDDCGGTDAPHGHRFGCGLEPEGEPSTGLDVATAGDAKPMRTDGPIVRRTAAERADEIDRRLGVDPESERRLDDFLAATAPPVVKMPLRVPMTAAMPDLGLDAASVERHWQGAIQMLRDDGEDVGALLDAAAKAMPETLPGPDDPRPPITPDVVRWVMTGEAGDTAPPDDD